MRILAGYVYTFQGILRNLPVDNQAKWVVQPVECGEQAEAECGPLAAVYAVQLMVLGELSEGVRRLQGAAARKVVRECIESSSVESILVL